MSAQPTEARTSPRRARQRTTGEIRSSSRVPAARFRSVMANVATPVAVVTTFCEGVPYGSTVSAFVSLSLDPPMVLVALDRRSTLLAALTESRTFGLNLLAHDQSELATTFAVSGSSGRFKEIDWATVDGLPCLAGIAGWVAGQVTTLVPGGDHVIVLGDVVAASEHPLRPLTYHRRGYGVHAPFERPGRTGADESGSSSPDSTRASLSLAREEGEDTCP